LIVEKKELKELPHPDLRYACDIFQKYQILKIGEGVKEKRFLVPRNDRIVSYRQGKYPRFLNILK
jgi:hypothetical protein